MPRRSSPTARQQRLGAELRKLRERAGVTARDAAAAVGLDQAKMSHLEAGRVAVGEERVRRLAAHYAVDDETLVDALAAMARERVRGWWEEYRDLVAPVLLDLAELEHHATALTSFQVVHIPGLLQTEAYARSMYAHAMSDMDPDELRAATSFRVQRRRILDREQPPALDVVIHEAALRIRIGDREVTREQLGFILEMAAHPAVSVRVIPFERDGFSGSGFSMLYLDGPVRKLDTAQFDTAHGSLFVDAETELAGYRAFLDRVRDLSLPEAASMDLIHRIARQL